MLLKIEVYKYSRRADATIQAIKLNFIIEMLNRFKIDESIKNRFKMDLAQDLNYMQCQGMIKKI